MMNNSLLLNLATWLPRSRANGPGTRMVIWLQGCPFRCNGCQNPEYLEFKMAKVLTVEQVWRVFLQMPDLDGISFSGGEPFAQAVALAELAKLVKSTGKTVLSWTGYRLEDLLSGNIKGAIDLLAQLDVLIDGLFLPHQVGDFKLRGSANQRLHFMSGEITEEDLINIPHQEWVLSDTTITYTGFPL
jgi:anaerobic ribonucleoside-triphosphate reductase activating protein